MNHEQLAELYRSAGEYHRALARYAACVRAGDDIEGACQRVIGTSLRYRCAIDRTLEDTASLEITASPGRLKYLRKMLAGMSRQYNLIKAKRATKVRQRLAHELSISLAGRPARGGRV